MRNRRGSVKRVRIKKNPHQLSPADSYQLLHEGSLALAMAERHGVCIDTEYCKKKIIYLDKQRRRNEKRLMRQPEIQLWKKKYRKSFKLGSDDQLADILYNELGYTPIKMTENSKGTDDEKGSTDNESLKAIDLPFIDMYLRGKKLKKAQDVISGILREQVNGVVHPSYALNFVDTFRGSCQDPNLQNVPVRDPYLQKLTRTAFLPVEGCQLLEIDYGRIEVHGASWYHQDPTMLKYLHDLSMDMHRDMAAQIYKLESAPADYWKDKTPGSGKDVRYCGKNRYVFPEFYGSYYAECAKNLWNSIRDMKLIDPQGRDLKAYLKSVGIGTYKKFEEHLRLVEKDFWERRFPVYQAWKDAWYDEYLKKGFFDSLSGFRYYGTLRKNQVINYPVQGVGFHCLLWSLKEVTRTLMERGLRSRPIMQIHDSIILNVYPNELREVVNICNQVMVKALTEAWRFIITPLEIDCDLAPVNGSWNLKSSIKLENYLD